VKQNTFKLTLLAMVSLVALIVTTACRVPVTDRDNENDEIEWTFDKEKFGGLPEGWTVAETAGAGRTATWKIVTDSSAPSKPHAMAVTESGNRGHTFNLIIAGATRYKNLEVAVQVKAVGGEEDQGGGPIWRAMDADNYYICRWNPLENNFRLYVVKDGRRKQLGSAEVDAQHDAWHEIEITHRGTKIVAEFDDRKLIELEDDTFQDAGMVGLWTKADATTRFDDIEVEVVDDQAVSQQD
jgi:hypothetical protein